MSALRETAGRDEPLVVYYDGACLLCRSEIGFYRRRVMPGAVQWVDVNAGSGAALPLDLDRERALARFHVRLPDGRLADGARGFAALWRAVPGWRALGRFADRPLVAPALEAAYRAFLFLRPALQRTAGWLVRAPRWPRRPRDRMQ